MQLRNMHATVSHEPTITLKLHNGGTVVLKDATLLTSYAFRVVVYCEGHVYLLPRYDYSVTTWKHIHVFIQDHCHMVRDVPAKDMRYAAEHELKNGEYMLADGIVSRNGQLETY